MDKPKKKRKLWILKVFIFFIIVFLAFIIYSPFIFLQLSPFLVKNILHKNFTFEKVKYSPIKGRVVIKSLSLSEFEGDSIFKINLLSLDVDVLKTLKLQPTISSIVIDSPETFIERVGPKDIRFPLSFDKKEQKSYSLSSINFPFSIEQIQLSNGLLKLKENGNFKNLISDLSVVIPGINIVEKKEIIPVIEGKFADKEFKIKGKTVLNNNSLSNQFSLIFNNFDLREISEYIPDIKKIKIVSGFVDAGFNINFITYKNRKPSLIIDGEATCKELFLKDIWSGLPFLEKGNGSVKISSLDVFDRILDIDSIFINDGKLTLAYSRKLEEKSTFFVKSKSVKKKFRVNIKELKSEQLDLSFMNRINDSIYEFYKSAINIENFTNYSQEESNFSLDGQAYGVGSIKSEGIFNLSEKDVIFDKMDLTNLDLNKFRILPLKTDTFKKAVVSKFDGKLKVGQKQFFISGKGNVLSFAIENDKVKLDFKNTDFDLDGFDLEDKIVSINSLECNDTFFYIKDKQIAIEDLYFALLKKEKPYNFNIESKSNIKKIFISEAFSVKNISGKYTEQDENLIFKISDLIFSEDINLSIFKSGRIETGGFIKSLNSLIELKDKPVLKIKEVSGNIGELKFNPFYLNLKEVNLVEPYVVFSINDDKRLYLFSFFELKKSKSSKEVDFLDIDSIKIDNGEINFSDYSLDDFFQINISKIDAEAKNFPSSIVPEGDFILNGVINNRNSISLNADIKKSVGISGKLDTKDLVLPSFSQYSEKYISHKIIGGVSDIGLLLNVNQDELNIDVDILLKSFKVAKFDSSDKMKIDLSKIIPMLEDRDGNIKIKIPTIKGNLTNPNIDYRLIFFNLFFGILSNSGKDIMSPFDQFKEDNKFEIIYFKPGKSEILVNNEDVFSKEMLAKFSNPKKDFIIEGYVDKNNDSAVIKNEILKEKMHLYSDVIPPSGSPEELDLLIKIYSSLNGEAATDDKSATELKLLIFDLLSVDNSEYYALSYARIKKIRELMINKYSVNPLRIGVSEKEIFENPYLEGINNSIAVIRSGSKSK